MHILFIGYGKTSQRVAKHLFEQGHHISTISRSAKTDCYATHAIQDIHLYAQQSQVQLKFKTFQISKVSQLKNKRIGILENNPPQQALVAKIRNRYVDSGYYDADFVDLIR